jgi:hypothetical protein
MDWNDLRKRLRIKLEGGLDADGATIDADTRARASKILDAMDGAVENASEVDIQDAEEFFSKTLKKLDDETKRLPHGIALTAETQQLEKSIFLDKVRLAASEAHNEVREKRRRRKSAEGGRRGANAKRAAAAKWRDDAEKQALELDRKGGVHASSGKAMAEQIHRTWSDDSDPPSIRSLERLIRVLKEDRKILRDK